MSEGSNRKKAALILLFTGTLLLLVSGLRSDFVTDQQFSSAGIIPEIPEITMPDGPLDINSAGTDELIHLYGIGKSLASMIIEERTKNGPFQYPEDLMSVNGIGPKKMEKILDSIHLR